MVVIVVVGIGALSFAPAITGWFARGAERSGTDDLTGRTNAWSAVLAQPRTEVNTLFGYGMSNDGSTAFPSIPAGCRPFRIKVSWVTSSRGWYWSPFLSWR